ncbi:gamma-glutamylcyclotransferase [Desulfuromonas sp.]|uniref:gamma-glutamylcyclotransferase n=1 Tax=Desulfuromonas sp. TaxID=892 RepID=UPI0025BF1087|nr:gamma-glutamylcyclotransferase [Desulfuromonas sp.]
MLYFAYGVNMDEETLAARGVTFTKMCRGKVRDMRLVFFKPGDDGTGKADLQDHRGNAVEGVVYDVPEESLARLDVYEGVDRGHYRRQAVVVQSSKGELDCVAYRATKFRTGLKPSPDYLGPIVRGAEAHRLSGDYITFLKSHDTMDASR